MHFTQHGNPHKDKRIERLIGYSQILCEMMDLFHDEFTTICPEDADNPQVYADLVGVAGEDDENIENYELGILVGKEMGCPLSDVLGIILEAEFAVQRLGRRLQDEVEYRNQKALDTKPQVKSIPPIKSIPVRSQPVSNNKSGEGTIYLIGNCENNTLKIGFSENSVRTRLAAFQVSCAHRLEILKTKKGTRQQEKELLERFKEFKIRNEWFTWNDSIIKGFDSNHE